VSNLPILRESADTVRLFSPATGEELDLATAALQQIAEVRCLIRDHEEDLRLAKRMLDAEILARMDRQAKWSWSADGFALSAPSPAPVTEYDAGRLRDRLDELAYNGVLERGAVDAAVELVVSYKPHPAGIKALAKLGGVVEETIAGCSTSSKRQRRVSVRRT